MQCAFPVRVLDRDVSCGRCMPCRINHLRKWLGRLMLESLCHEHTWFVTLTYADESLPMALDGVGRPTPTLRKGDVQKWLKRARRASYRVRYGLCGEYGAKTGRPHYHAILFGPDEAQVQDIVALWGHGHTQVAPCLPGAMRYTLQYTLKKMTSPEDERLDGREPEFWLSSRRPALGYPGLKYLVEPYQGESGSLVIERDGDVGRLFRAEGKKYPLDYRMLQTIRELLGIPTVAADRPTPLEYPRTVSLKDAGHLHDKLRRQADRRRTL